MDAEKLIDSTGCVDKSWEPTDNPELASIIAGIMGCCTTLEELFAAADIGYFRSIIVRIRERRGILEKSSNTHGFTGDKSFYTSKIDGPQTLNKSLDSMDGGTSVDRLWETSDPLHLESIVARIEEFRTTPNSWSGTTEGNANFHSDVALKAEFRTLSVKHLRGLMNDMSQVQLDITRMEEIIVAVRSQNSKKTLKFCLANVLFQRYLRFGDLGDLQRAVEGSEEGLTTRPPGHPLRLHMLALVAITNGERYTKLWRGGDCARVLEIVKEIAVLSVVPSHHTYALSQLSHCLKGRYRQTGVLGDLDKAIQASEEAIRLAPEVFLGRPGILDDLSDGFHMRFVRLGNIEDMNKAIMLSEDAIAATPHNIPNRPCLSHNLGNQYSERFEKTKNTKDLERAISLIEEAIEATPHHIIWRATMFRGLSSCYIKRFNHLGDIADIDRAILLCEEAIVAYPNECQSLSSVLGTCYHKRFCRFGAVDDLERSIRASEAALAATPNTSPDRWTLLASLGRRLGMKFNRSNALKDSERATGASEAALAATPIGHYDRAFTWFNLARDRTYKFLRFRDQDDLEIAIEASEDALAVSPVGHRLHADILAHLGQLLSEKWRITMNLGDNARAYKTCAEAVVLTPVDDPARASRLTDLSFQLATAHNKFRISKILSGFEIGLKHFEAQKLRISSNDPTKTARLQELNGFSNLLQLVCDKIGAIAKDNGTEDELVDVVELLINRCGIIELAAQFEAELLALHLPTHFPPLNSLAKTEAYRERVSDLNRSQDMLLAAWHCLKAHPRDRIRAARLAAKFLALGSRWEEASDLLQDAVRLLPQLTPQFLARDDQEHMLSGLTQLASEAVSMALQAGATPSHCLGLLELGRGVIMGLAINCRSDVSELQIKYPDICDKFNRLRTEIDTPLIGQDIDNLTNEGMRRRRVQAIKEIDEALVSIRQLPDFAGFQLAPRPKDLTALAANGPIIIINTTELRSDAILVTSCIKSISLPKMMYSDVVNQMTELPRLVEGRRSTWRPRNDRMAEILLWLWEVAVEPVLEELGPDIPRVWWIGVGPLANAPFHAAGEHSHGSTRNTISRVISSYIPTIKALMYATQKNLELNSLDSRLLLVTMPTTPDTPAIPLTSTVKSSRTKDTPAPSPATAPLPVKRWKPLQKVATEANEIMDAVGSTLTTRFDCPTMSQVLENLPTHTVIHFACHGVSDRINPSCSHLILCGDNPLEAGKLTVGDISNMNLQNAQIAYLSACSTADNCSTKLADESIHIASGFQLTGFSHVLGTLWSSDDDACRRVAGEFYRTLFKGKGGGGHRAVSTAFHHAVLELRKDLWRQPIKWVPFIHIGA